MKNKILMIFIVMLMIITITIAAKTFTRYDITFESMSFSTPTNALPVLVTRHVDGDTFEVTIKGTKETLRIVGVDTPETVHPRKEVEFYGLEASKFTKSLCKINDVVYLTFEGDKKRGYYGRLLTYVWFKTNDGQWQQLNYILVRNGYSPYYDKYDFDPYYMELFKKAAILAELECKGVHLEQ